MLAWWMATPFVVMLLAIAILPLVGPTQHWWEKPGHQLLVAACLGIPVAIMMLLAGHGHAVGDSLIEYAQFIVLLFGLFTIAGGIALTGDLAGTPKVNTIFMAVGTILASFIGTTGAAMLLIRPMLLSNAHRRHRVHLVVFAVFTMANCGGLLTPLGDPPLFLGLLRGVPFAWTFGLWPQWLFVNAILLITFYCIDTALMDDENRTLDIVEPLGVKGKLQVLWFAVVVLGVAFVPSVQLGQDSPSWASYVPWRELVILAAAGLSWMTSHSVARFEINEFTFLPIKEVAALFFGIFLTMVPALLLLDEHAADLPLTGVALHLMTGGLSSVLDNAPTYASFFTVAQASAGSLPGVTLVAGVPQAFLVAISTGAVFWGAMTYIGNGPNFMLRAIAVHHGVRMPSFLGYIGWSARWLLPVLVACMLVFIAPSWPANAVGWAMAALLIIQAGLIRVRSRVVRLPSTPH